MGTESGNGVDEIETIGRILTGQVTDENEQNYFVQIEGTTFLLAKTEIEKPLKLGSNFTGFTYENEHHKLQITRLRPKVQIDQYAFAKVVGQKHDLGVFVDIGLPNKDIAVSLDELPTVRSLWPKEGDRLLVCLGVDKKNRLWAHLADEDIFAAIARPAASNLKNKNIKTTAYRLKMAGTRLLTENYELAFLHPSERVEEPRLGQQVEARVIGMLRDGSINLSTLPRAYQAIDDDSAMILALLKRDADHFLPYTDHSDPALIKEFFGISKGAFKRAVGHLLKAKLIVETDAGLSLIEDESNE